MNSNASATGSADDTDRAALGFREAAEREFAFMAAHGFRVVEASPTIVRFRKDDWFANVYHGRHSYEIGFEIGPGDEQYSLGAILGTVNPDAAKRFRYPAVRTPDQVAAALTMVAGMVQAHAADALNLRPEFVECQKAYRALAGRELELDVLERQHRPEAEAAFRDRRWADAVILYEVFEPRLTGTEKLKLSTARKRSGLGSSDTAR